MVLRDTTRTIREPTKGTSQGMAVMEAMAAMAARKEVVWQVVDIVVGNISIIGVTHGIKSQRTRWLPGLT